MWYFWANRVELNCLPYLSGGELKIFVSRRNPFPFWVEFHFSWLFKLYLAASTFSSQEREREREICTCQNLQKVLAVTWYPIFVLNKFYLNFKSKYANGKQWHSAADFFTQSVLRGVIRRRLGYLINKKCFFHYKNDHFMQRILP